MISRTAIDDIEDMKADGLDPTPEDIIRLNAIGCKLDHAASGGLEAYQRTATVCGVTLYQPTIAHDLLAAKFADVFDLTEPATFICTRAFICHFAPGNVPENLTEYGAEQAVSKWIYDHFKPATIGQLAAAVNYVLYGADSAALEYPERAAAEMGVDDAFIRDTADETARGDILAEVAVGAIRRAEMLALGISLADAKRHTAAELYEICNRAELLQLRANAPSQYNERLRDFDARMLGAYGDTRAAIRKRLEEERAASESKTDNEKG